MKLLRYKFSSPNLIRPLTKKIPIQAHNYFGPTWIFLTYFLYITQIFSILLPNLDSYKYFPYKPHKLSWTLSQILPIISHILSNLGFYKNSYHTTTKIGLQNYTISTKTPKLIYLMGKTQEAQQNPLTKPVATRHPKTRYYIAPLKLVATRHL